MATKKKRQVEVRNINHPGSRSKVDAQHYEAMRKALLAALPRKAPGLNAQQMHAAVVQRLPEALFPGGARAGWWLKCVQLDLEARKRIKREPVRPLRWHRL
jgi:hypothetical protein